MQCWGHCSVALLLVSIFSLVLTERLHAAPSSVDTYMGACDGSAAVPIGPSSFIAASDEDNILRVYKYGTPDPSKEIDLNDFLQLKAESKEEVDIEGAARIGNRVYWIGSHSQDKKGDKQPNRARLVATDVKVQGDEIQIIPAGVPYKKLRKDLASSDFLQTYNLAKAGKLAPQIPGGLNIEGLAATPEGDLLIAFRNPLPDNKALIIPLKNPTKVIRGKRAKLGPPILLPLDGLGIRSIDYSSARNSYLILAGSSVGDEPDFRFKLYEWPGPGSTEVSLIKELTMNDSKVQPEAIFTQAKETAAYILSDDGESKDNTKGVRCKDLPTQERSFHGFWVR